MSTQALGKKLKSTREEKGWSIDQAAEKTFIKPHYLQSLERGDFGALPSAVQVRGFIRTYAGALGLESESLFAMLQPAQAQPVDLVDLALEAPEPTPDASEPSGFSAEDIFNELGTQLTQRRELLGISKDDTAELTHIPRRYLDLIESGDFDAFPSPVQARGMLGNYAGFLEMDSESILLRYAEALQTRLAVRQASAAPTRTRPEKQETKRQIRLPLWLQTILSPDLITVALVTLVLTGFFIWGMGQVIELQAGLNPQPTAPGLAGVLLPSDTPTAIVQIDLAASPTPAQNVGGEDTAPEATETTLIPIGGDEPVRVYIVVRQRAYLRVTVDDEQVFDERVVPGQTFNFNGTSQVEVLTGNGAGIQVFYNDIDQGPLGLFGQIINIIYSPQGPILPTSTPVPTQDPAQITPTLTPTPVEE